MFILFDDHRRVQLLPLTFTRPCCELRVGITTIREKWELRLQKKASFLTVAYLQEKYPLQRNQDNIVVNSRILPCDALLEEIDKLHLGEIIFKGETFVAARLTDEQVDILHKYHVVEGAKYREVSTDFMIINRPYDLFQQNDKALRDDFALLTKGRSSQALSGTNQLLGDAIFIEEGAKVECSILNTLTGPIYIGKKAEIMEGCIVRGGLAMCAGSQLKMGAKIYGATTLGPESRGGGEINNSILLGYSNKGHDGFLGNSVLGEWCNLGADTNNSNLKNNYAEVKLWSYESKSFESTGLQFCGLIMGDHSKSGINTMFNTGTVVGVSCNIFGAGFPRNFVPSFSWGGAAGNTIFQLDKVYEAASLVMERRGKELDQIEKNILHKVFELEHPAK